MRTYFYFVFLFVVMFFLIVFPFEPMYSQDFVYHFLHSGGDSSLFVGVEDRLVSQPYPPFVHVISSFFAVQGIDFFISFWFLVIFCLVPVVFFVLLRDFRLFFLYLAIPLPYFTWYFFTLSQFFVSFLAVLFLIVILRFSLVKSAFLFLFFFVLAFFTHYQGIFLVSLVYAVYLLHYFLDTFKVYDKIKLLFLLIPQNVILVKNELPFLSMPWHIVVFKFLCLPWWFLVRKWNVFLTVSLLIYLLSFFGSSRVANTASLFLCVGLVLSLKEKPVSDKLFLIIFFFMFLIQLFVG